MAGSCSMSAKDPPSMLSLPGVAAGSRQVCCMGAEISTQFSQKWQTTMQKLLTRSVL